MAVHNKNFFRFVSLLLSLIMLFMFIPAHAANGEWDGFVKTAGAGDSVDLIDFNDIGGIVDSRAVPSGDHTRDGIYSAYWGNHTMTKSIDFKNVEKDWSNFDSMELWIYSETAVDADIVIVVYCENVQATGDSYFYEKIKLDWSGWKRITLGLGAMASVRSPKLSQVKGLTFAASGWECTPDANSSLYIASAKLKNTSNGSLDIIYSEDDISKANEAVKNAAAVYGGSPNVLYHGEIEKLSENNSAAEYTGTAVRVPVDFFEKYLNAAVNKSDNKCIITLGEHTLTLTDGSRVYNIDGETGELEEAAETKGEVFYVPVWKCAELLGKNTVVSGKLVVIGDDDKIDVLRDNSNINVLNEIIAYITAYSYIDPASITAGDMKKIKDRWRYELVGDETNDLTDEKILTRTKSIEAQGRAMWSQVIKDENSEEIFTNMKTVASADLTTIYSKINAMAEAYAVYGSELYHNEELLNDIIYCLDFMYQKRYGQAEIENRGWRSTSDFNWFDWQIGAPRHLIPTLMLIEDKLTPAQIKNYLSLFDALVTTPNGEGSNKLNVGKLAIGSALLKNDAAQAIKVRDALDDVFLYVDNGRNEGEGFYTDGSYVFHSHHPLTGAYGIEHLTNAASMVSLLSGSKLEIQTPQAYNIVDWVYNGFEPLIYKGAIMRMVKGRDPSRGHSIGCATVAAMLTLTDFLSDKDKAEFKSIIKAQVTEDTSVNYYSSLSLVNLIRLENIMNDESIEPRGDYKLNKVYYNMDKVVHQRGDFAVGISMSSSRIYPYESINGENLTGWYIGDGMVSVYNDDLYQYDTLYWANVDPYRLAGTTADNQERKAVSIYQPWIGSKDFVGGVSLNGEYGVATMDLESYHNAEDTGVDMGSSGGPAPKHNCTLEAKKSWFLFDDEFVCLGADITANDGYDVLTIVENRMADDKKTVRVGGQDNIKYDIAAVSASQIPEAENVPENTIDGILTTKWSANGDAEIIYDLGEIKTVGIMGLSFMYGSQRQQLMDIEVSADEKNWTQVFSGMSSGLTDGEEAYDLKNSEARFVRVKVHGTTKGTWTSMTEAAIYAPNADGSVKLQNARYVGAEKVTAEDAAGNSETLNLMDEDKAISSKWVHLENTGGYYFPNGGNLFAKKTEDKVSFFQLWFNHGTSPQKQTYAYVQLPNKTAEQTKAYAQNPDVEILINTPDIQAVKEKNLGVTGIVFRKAGEFDGIKVSQPMIVMKKETEGSFAISVSDPTHKLESAVVEINKKLETARADERIQINNEGITRLSVDFNNSRGESIGAEFLD